MVRGARPERRADLLPPPVARRGIAWPFVPWNAKLPTPRRAKRSTRRDAAAASCRHTRASGRAPPADILAVSNTPATCGLTRTRCSTRDEHARFSGSAGCAKAPRRAAHSVCPTKDLTASSVSGAPSSRPSAASDAPNSMGSRLVPVPCICNVCTSPGRMDPASSAARITARCAKPLGAVAAGSSVLVHRRGRERHATGRDLIREHRLRAPRHPSPRRERTRPRTRRGSCTFRRESIPARKRGGGGVRDDGVRAARRRAIDLSVPQFRRGDVRGDDGRTARRVGERGAVHAEDETQTTRRAAQGIPVRCTGAGLGGAGSALVPERDDVRVLVPLVGDADERAASHGSAPVAFEIIPSRRQRALLRRSACINISKSWRCCGSINSASV